VGSSQNIAQNNAMVRISDLELDSWHFASLWMSVESWFVIEDKSQLTYMPTIKPINTVFRQAIVAVMRFLTVCHSLAIGWRW
jgi:acyl carrier protein